jgi:cell wall-associated NlpC family hydrolase
VLPQKSWAHLVPGDLLYRKDGGHVVIYAGGGRVVAAPHTGTNVQYEPLSYFPSSQYDVHYVPKPGRR